jgi:integrase
MVASVDDRSEEAIDTITSNTANAERLVPITPETADAVKDYLSITTPSQ